MIIVCCKKGELKMTRKLFNEIIDLIYGVGILSLAFLGVIFLITQIGSLTLW